MAKNESLAVLHATLDFRRAIDMPGYDRIPLHDAARFIATMNYGYAGTRELNEALASRFVVIDMPAITTRVLMKLLKREFPALKDAYAEQFAGLFQDIPEEVRRRGAVHQAPGPAGPALLRAAHGHGAGGQPRPGSGPCEQILDDFERQLVRDVIRTRLRRSSAGRTCLPDGDPGEREAPGQEPDLERRRGLRLRAGLQGLRRGRPGGPVLEQHHRRGAEKTTGRRPSRASLRPCMAAPGSSSSSSSSGWGWRTPSTSGRPPAAPPCPPCGGATPAGPWPWTRTRTPSDLLAVLENAHFRRAPWGE